MKNSGLHQINIVPHLSGQNLWKEVQKRKYDEAGLDQEKSEDKKRSKPEIKDLKANIDDDQESNIKCNEKNDSMHDIAQDDPKDDDISIGDHDSDASGGLMDDDLYGDLDMGNDIKNDDDDDDNEEEDLVSNRNTKLASDIDDDLNIDNEHNGNTNRDGSGEASQIVFNNKKEFVQYACEQVYKQNCIDVTAANDRNDPSYAIQDVSYGRLDTWGQSIRGTDFASRFIQTYATNWIEHDQTMATSALTK